MEVDVEVHGNTSANFHGRKSTYIIFNSSKYTHNVLAWKLVEAPMVVRLVPFTPSLLLLISLEVGGKFSESK